MANNYQRTSSAVEGRNGYLTRLHHSSRGFSQQTLKGLTIIHNFRLKRPDGTTAAQRLYDYEFPDLFEWVVNHLGDLPPRSSVVKITNTESLSPTRFPDLKYRPILANPR